MRPKELVFSGFLAHSHPIFHLEACLECPPVIVQGTRALVDPSPLALLLSESWKVVLPHAADASNASNAADAPRRARFDWSAARVDEWRGGLTLIRRLASL